MIILSFPCKEIFPVMPITGTIGTIRQHTARFPDDQARAGSIYRISVDRVYIDLQDQEKQPYQRGKKRL
jgi:hypothetical protein